jgi:RimJ/RimL family protein N-acetyltransferase
LRRSTGVETEEDPFKSMTYERIKFMVSSENFAFAIELQEAGADGIIPVIGVIGLFRPPALGYLIDEPYWGQGYATEALRAFVQTYWGYFPHGVPGLQPDEQDVLHAGVFEGNLASERVLLKVGFKEFRRGVFEADNGPVNDIMFSLKRPARVGALN